MVKVCLSCGKPIPEGSRFCPECGTEIRDLCPKCGAPVTGARFCQECGTKLIRDEPESGSVAPAAVPFPSYTSDDVESETDYQTPNRSAPAEQPTGSSPFEVAGSADGKRPEKKRNKPVYKKWWFWVLAALAALVVLGAAGGSQDEPVSVKKEGTESAEKQDSSAKEPKKQEPQEEKEEDDTAIKETVLFNEQDVIITAKSFSTGGSYDPELKLFIENNSDQDLTFQVRNVSVNGYMMEPVFSADVASGKKANDSLIFSRSDLKQCGIDTVADIEFHFHIFDTDTWEDEFNSDKITLETSAAEGFQYTFDDSGELVYEGGGVVIKARELTDDDSFFGSSIMVYIENNSDRDITVQTRDVSVNGFMVEPIFSTDVCAGKHAVSGITLMESDIEQNEIESIDSVELSFHIFDMDSWDTIVDTDKVTIEF